MKRHSDHKSHYLWFGLELTADFVVMYLVMYAMIATLAHFEFNLNNVYMTLMMVAPMTIVMIVSMRSMFPSQRLNVIVGIGAVTVFLGSFAAIRTQTGVGNTDFLR